MGSPAPPAVVRGAARRGVRAGSPWRAVRVPLPFRRNGTCSGEQVASAPMVERLLWSPLRLGPVTLANRVVFSAHLTNYATQSGLPSDQHAAYYAARAAGGAGLIITEEHSTHPTDWPYEKLIHGFRPDLRPDQAQRRAGVVDVQPVARVGAVAGSRPAVS